MPAAEKDGIHLTLDQAIGLALSNNQDLNVTVNAAEASQFTLFQNTGIFDPLASASISRSHQDNPASSQLAGATVLTADQINGSAQVSQLIPIGGTFTLGFAANRTNTNSTFAQVNPSYTAGLQLSFSQPLLRNSGKLPTTWRIDVARNARDASYQDFVRGVQATVNSVEQAYWDLVYAYGNLTVKQEAKNLAVEQNRITRIKIDVGSLAPIDIVQTEVDIATAEQEIISAEGLIGTAQDQLKRLLTVGPEDWGDLPIIPTDSIVAGKQSFNLGEGMKTALQRRPEILQQQYLVASDELRFQFFKNQTLPQLDLQGGYGRNGLGGTAIIRDPNTGEIVSQIPGGFGDALSDIFGKNFKSWNVGLVFSYPILNRAARGAAGNAQFTLETDKARLTVLEQDIIVSVRLAHRAIEIASRQIDAAAKGRELAERNLDAARKKFDNGMSTSFEVSKITNDLSDARSKELNALAIYRKAISAYHQAIADILEWKGVKIEGMPEMAPPPAEARADLVRRVLEAEAAAP
jgi:outer membrane protein TolC